MRAEGQRGDNAAVISCKVGDYAAPQRRANDQAAKQQYNWPWPTAVRVLDWSSGEFNLQHGNLPSGLAMAKLLLAAKELGQFNICQVWAVFVKGVATLREDAHDCAGDTTAQFVRLPGLVKTVLAAPEH